MPFAVLITQHDKGKLIASALAKLGATRKYVGGAERSHFSNQQQ